MKAKSQSRVVGPVNQKGELDAQFSRYLGSLKLIAQRVLEGDDEVREALRRGYLAAAGQGRKLENGGEFRRRLVRTVLNEALLILQEKESAADQSSGAIFWQFC